MGARCFLILLSIAGVTCDITTEVWQNGLFKIPDLRTICSYFKNVSDINTKCAEQLNIVCRNITLLLTMLDASSKFPFTGLGFAGQRDLGNFDQCLTIDHSYEGGRILGEHCTEGLIVPDPFKNMSDAETYYVLSVCRPDGCNASDYNAVVLGLLDMYLPEVFLDEKCEKAKSPEAFNAVETVTLQVPFSIFQIDSSLK